MRSLDNQTIVAAGGTANVGSFVVGALLERGATVAVPSRSEERLDGLREHLKPVVGETAMDRLHTLVGDLSDETGAASLGRRIAEEAGTPDAVLASLGNFVTTPSLLEASKDDLRRALDGYLVSHFMVACAFAPALRGSGGTYLFLQGPLAFELNPEFGTDLISIATAAQHMLFRSLAKELDGSPARVVELVSHAFIREKQTQPGSTLSGEAVGAYAAYLFSGGGGDLHGESIHLRSPEQLAEAGLEIG